MALTNDLAMWARLNLLYQHDHETEAQFTKRVKDARDDYNGVPACPPPLQARESIDGRELYRRYTTAMTAHAWPTQPEWSKLHSEIRAVWMDLAATLDRQ